MTESGRAIREAVERLAAARTEMTAEIGKVIVGQRHVIDHLLITILCRGHALMVGVPGIAKTMMVKTISEVLDLKFSRIQFTPDLMPSDITGTDVIEEDVSTGHRVVKFIKGPIFANIVLADEINRTPPKTQAAMLQVMEEHEVTVGTKTYPLEEPFFVIATQNPIELEGVYPLPEAQLDRFMFNLRVHYPTVAEEVAVVQSTTSTYKAELRSVLTGQDIVRLQGLVRQVPIADEVVEYAVRLVSATRPDRPEAPDFVKEYLSWGASPRASQYLTLGAKARAILQGNLAVTFDDVRAVAEPVLHHRIILNFHARSEDVQPETIIERLVDSVSTSMAR
ncbi:MAG: MoxR family ATPase [Verrucomicrobia bacterium]|nr:MoxR family ATPase [Verrucomicrobiota bacterium]